MKKWLVPAIISAFALSLFEMWVCPLSPYEIESRPLPPEQEKAAIRLAQLPSLTLLYFVPGINFFLIYARFYGHARQKQSPDEADGTAGTETLIGFAIWLVVFITVALLRPKWWYLAVAFALTVGAAVWISQLPDSSLSG